PIFREHDAAGGQGGDVGGRQGAGETASVAAGEETLDDAVGEGGMAGGQPQHELADAGEIVEDDVLAEEAVLLSDFEPFEGQVGVVVAPPAAADEMEVPGTARLGDDASESRGSEAREALRAADDHLRRPLWVGF